MSSAAIGLRLVTRRSSSPWLRAALVAVGGALLAAGLVSLLVVAAIVGIGEQTNSGGSGIKAGLVPPALVPVFTAAARTCPALTPPLLAAQAKTESGFSSTAVSPSGAVGIAQFMPGTWALWGSDANGDGTADPRDPTDAIYAQARYDCALAADLKAVPGDPVPLMLAAYNAGPYSVIESGGVPSFTETQNYVRTILDTSREVAAPPTSSIDTTFAATASAGPTAARAIGFAGSKIGTPYEWGGDGADGLFDCSGLTKAAYRSAGISLPRTAAEQWWTGPHPPQGAEQPGDLVFFGGTPGSISHVGVVIGNGLMVDAPHTGAVVRIEAYADWGDLYGFTRPA